MDPVPLQIHLNYMTDAAHLLRFSAPETSAYLMSHRNELMFQRNAAQTDVQKQHVCNACGHIMIPGQTTMMDMETLRLSRRSDARKDSKLKTKAGGSMQLGRTSKVFTCGFCDGVTRIQLPESPQAWRGKLRRSSTATANDEKSGTSGMVRRSENASSKRRAKNRKAGLQALLDKSQAGSPPGSRSLSLADFMKK